MVSSRAESTDMDGVVLVSAARMISLTGAHYSGAGLYIAGCEGVWCDSVQGFLHLSRGTLRREKDPPEDMSRYVLNSLSRPT
jgi:hypothetical protein